VIETFKDNRIRFMHSPINRGVSATLNDAIVRSTGAYIAVLNSDDVFLSDKLRAQVALLDSRPEVGAVFGYPEFIDDNDAVLPSEKTFYGNVFRVANRSPSEWLRRFFYEGNCLCHPSVMIRRECHDQLGLYDERLAQLHDLDVWLRVLNRSEIFVITEPVLLFRILSEEGNASSPRPDVRTRTFWEEAKVMRRYADLHNALFDRVFEADLRRLEIDMSISQSEKLAWLALDRNTPWSVWMGLDLLYQSIGPSNSPREHLGGPNARFTHLTGKWDLFGLHADGPLQKELASCALTIRELQDQLTHHDSARSQGKLGKWFPGFRNK
jgi:glycosyltransferase involved in cell wall biosynthesis